MEDRKPLAPSSIFDPPSSLSIPVAGRAIAIGRTTFDHLIDLRHRVLRADLPRETALFPDDPLATSLHFAAADGSVVVGCASFHLKPWEDQPAWQLRGMATDESIRRTGVGRELLRFAETFASSERPGIPFWCNARLVAVPFYQSQGWAIASGQFDIPTAGPHHRMFKLASL